MKKHFIDGFLLSFTHIAKLTLIRTHKFQITLDVKAFEASSTKNE